MSDREQMWNDACAASFAGQHELPKVKKENELLRATIDELREALRSALPILKYLARQEAKRSTSGALDSAHRAVYERAREALGDE